MPTKTKTKPAASTEAQPKPINLLAVESANSEEIERRTRLGV